MLRTRNAFIGTSIEGTSMKKTALTSASLALLVAAGSAHAQNSVTLYGVIDAGIGYVHNADSGSNLTGMLNGNLSGDRWGLKGDRKSVV